MIRLTPQMRILVAVEPADFRKGIDGLCGIFSTIRRSAPNSMVSEDGSGASAIQPRMQPPSARIGAILWRGVRLQEPAGDGDQATGLRRSGVLAVPEASVEGTVPALAGGRRSGPARAVRTRAAGAPGRRRPHGDAGDCTVAANPAGDGRLRWRVGPACQARRTRGRPCGAEAQAARGRESFAGRSVVRESVWRKVQGSQSAGFFST